MIKYVWLVPFFPLIGVLINGLLGWKLEKTCKSIIHWVACGAVGLSFLVVWMIFRELLSLPPEHRHFEIIVYNWFTSGVLSVNVAYLVDPLSITMSLFVTGVGFLIHVYSIGYMGHDEGRYYRYFTYLNLFMFSMINLILANNFVLMFLGWEGVGVCSYLLIGFWFHNKEFASAGKKAFVFNRIGDFGFVLGMFLLFFTVGKYTNIYTLNFYQSLAHVKLIPVAVASVIGLLLFVGATGKSAQIPLYVWLPDAMAGPTPVSALIHAATMVTAGVYMVARCAPLYLHGHGAMEVVAIIGAVTSFFAATIAVAQYDIKKVIAYSTISQLGYMFLGVGVAAFSAGVFHIVTHSFFKALLFLGAGSVIHALSGEQDMRKMGGLKNKIPVTYWTFLIACLAISGIPGLSGFFSKDEILGRTFASGHYFLWFIGTVTAGLTAFYMFRVLFMTFFGESRVEPETAKHIHESPATMTVPMIILAILSVVGGYIGVPHILGGSNRIEQFLEPSFSYGGIETEHLFHHVPVGIEYLLMVIAVLVGLAGIYTAYLFYMKNRAIPENLVKNYPTLHKLLYNKWYVDEIYEAVFEKPGHFIGSVFWVIWDELIIDGIVIGISNIVRGIGTGLRFVQTGSVQFYAVGVLLGIVITVSYFLNF
jgi:NADH-quinone oxidoreductase subunit L